MKAYFDSSVFANPVYEYFKWLKVKLYYQTKYWGKHLRIGYRTYIAKTSFGKYNYIGRNVLMYNSEIGDFTYISNDSAVTHSSIGKFCSIGPGVRIAPGRHPTSKFVSTHPSLFSQPSFLKRHFVSDSKFEGNLKVSIGNDVWIGANSVIIDGVSIGDGAILGANSVVTRNVEPYSIVGGIPAKFIRKRFDKDEIERLLQLKWWDKSEGWIQHHADAFSDIKKFVNL